MMNKFKKWLWKTDEEGVSNFDAITVTVVMSVAWGLILLLAASAR